MAIRFPTLHSASFNANDWPHLAAIKSGWRAPMEIVGAVIDPRTTSLMHWQPSALSRPDNLGAAYASSWTEDISSPNDNHIPIPFKVFVFRKNLEPRRIIRRFTHQSSRSPS